MHASAAARDEGERSERPQGPDGARESSGESGHRTRVKAMWVPGPPLAGSDIHRRDSGRGCSRRGRPVRVRARSTEPRWRSPRRPVPMRRPLQANGTSTARTVHAEPAVSSLHRTGCPAPDFELPTCVPSAMAPSRTKPPVPRVHARQRDRCNRMWPGMRGVQCMLPRHRVERMHVRRCRMRVATMRPPRGALPDERRSASARQARRHALHCVPEARRHPVFALRPLRTCSL